MKAKTKISLITILNAILCVVFAFIIGGAWCLGGTSVITKNEHTKKYATASYLANNNWHVVNATRENPIPYEPGLHNTSVKLNYAMLYDFDVRFDYELVWINSDGTETDLGTDNVILNYANRDAYIVDAEYIFLNDTVRAGEGNLSLFTGVSFVNTDDATYFGKSLKINVQAQITKMKKSINEYTKSHELYVDSTAGNAWYKIMSGLKASESTADLIVYNYRYDTDHGIKHPSEVTAYNGTVPIYGNRYYAGAGMYVITGSNATTIKIESLGSWNFVGKYEYRANNSSEWKTGTYYELVEEKYVLLNEKPDNWDSQYNTYFIKYAPAAFENNIYYNFDKTNFSEITHATNSNRTISAITVPAHSYVYINIYDSIEITSVAETESGLVDFTDYILTSSFTINGVHSISNNKLTVLSGVTSDSSHAATTYAAKEYSIINTSVYDPWLYDVSANSGIDEYGDLAITNNTAYTQTYDVTYKLEYVRSNGKNSLQESGGSASSFSGEYWSEETSVYEASATRKTVNVAPYSTVSLSNSVSIPYRSGMGNFDYWVSWNVSVEPSRNSTEIVASNDVANSVSVETKTNGNYINVSVRNNTGSAVSLNNATVGYKILTYKFSALSTQPGDWATKYWEYYRKEDGLFVRANKYNSFVAGQFYERELETISDSISVNATLAANESLVVSSSAISVRPQYSENSIDFMQEIVIDGSVAGVIANGAVGVVNNGAAQDKSINKAFIINSSFDTSYYVRISSNYNGSDVRFKKSGDYNYFIGIIRPNQTITIDVGGNVTVEEIAVSGDYSLSALESWNPDTTITNEFEKYFALS